MMQTIERRLKRFLSHRFDIASAVAPDPSLPAPLQTLYDGFNGGFYWQRALLIRPLHKTEGAPLPVTEWNDTALWKREYGDICEDVFFFADDVFGGQFGLQDNRVVQFDPETAGLEEVAKTLDGWCKEILRDPEFYTGFPVLHAWEQEKGQIPAGFRLIPKQPFMLGGDFDASNMVSKPDVEGMKIRAQLWTLTKDLPDGQTIVFRVEE